MSRDHRPLSNGQLLKLAWRIIGGWSGIRGTWHFRVALLVWLVSSLTWIEPDWWKDVMTVAPSLLGFTLGGFAIFLGFGSDAFKEMIASEEEEEAEYLSVSAAFLFFVLVQLAALIWAVACATTWQPTPAWLLPLRDVFLYGRFLFWGIGYFLFVYGLLLTGVVALRVFRLSRWYNSFLAYKMRSKQEEGAEASNR
jgi:hypothetical protein